MTLITQWKPLMNEKHRNIFTIEFDRLIGEDQMDDLVEMLDYMLESLNCLQI
jgi:hypothetical protein